ncbi:MAG: hypothetical protein ABIK20_04895 [Candidatus Omnitrophota bacterium]
MILKIIGSNPLFQDRRLLLDFKKPFLEIEKVKNTLTPGNSGFELVKTVENKGGIASEGGMSLTWLGEVDSNYVS